MECLLHLSLFILLYNDISGYGDGRSAVLKESDSDTSLEIDLIASQGIEIIPEFKNQICCCHESFNCPECLNYNCCRNFNYHLPFLSHPNYVKWYDSIDVSSEILSLEQKYGGVLRHLPARPVLSSLLPWLKVNDNIKDIDYTGPIDYKNESFYPFHQSYISQISVYLSEDNFIHTNFPSCLVYRLCNSSPSSFNGIKEFMDFFPSFLHNSSIVFSPSAITFSLLLTNLLFSFVHEHTLSLILSHLSSSSSSSSQLLSLQSLSSAVSVSPEKLEVSSSNSFISSVLSSVFPNLSSFFSSSSSLSATSSSMLASIASTSLYTSSQSFILNPDLLGYIVKFVNSPLSSPTYMRFFFLLFFSNYN
jgi:hypothetical protein